MPYNSLSTRIIANFVVLRNERVFCATVLLLLSRLMSATTPQRLFLARLSYSCADRAGLSTIVIKKNRAPAAGRVGRARAVPINLVMAEKLPRLRSKTHPRPPFSHNTCELHVIAALLSPPSLLSPPRTPLTI